MSEQGQNESLSCFMDGELNDYAAVMDQLCRSHEAKSYWSRCHLIREVLQNNHFHSLTPGFSSRVMQALENEPVVLNPRFSSHAATPGRRFLKPVAGLAIAASVAAITVLGIQTFYLPQPHTFVDTASSSSFQTLPDVSPDSTFATTKLVDRKVPPANPQGQEEELNSYLLEHMEYSAAGVQSMMPYVRLAGFEGGQ